MFPKIILFNLKQISANDTVKLAFLIGYITNMLVELIIPCYFGSLVIAQSERLSVSVFQCDWHGQPLRFQWMVRMVIVAAQRPIVLYTFKGLFVIALPTFVTV